MEEHVVKIIKTEQLTHGVKRFTVEKPAGYSFIPGQATEVAINKPGYRDERRSFTFTGLNKWPHLEFTIKIYSDHEGVTKMLGNLVPGDELIIHDVWGTIGYKEAGLFIAGGAGITPFIAILRDLYSKNKIGENSLLFANKTKADIILKDEFEKMLGSSFINILSDEETKEYPHGFISVEFLKHFICHKKMIYLCGPPKMMEIVEKQLEYLKIDNKSIVKEVF